MIAPRINLQPAVKALEWLVRRFQIHVHNQELLLLTILPYYSSSIFSRVLDIIPLPLPPVFSFLTNSKKTVSNPSRTLIVRALSSDQQLCQLISSFTLDQIQSGHEYTALLAFWSSTSIWTMVALKEKGIIAEDVVSLFLPYIAPMLSFRKSSSTQIAAYMTLVVLATQFNLEDSVVEAAVSSIVLNWSKQSAKSGISCICQLVQANEVNVEVPMSKQLWDGLEKAKFVDQEVVSLASKYYIGRFITLYGISLLHYAPEKVEVVEKILSSCVLAKLELKPLVKALINSSIANVVDSKESFAHFFDTLLSDPVSEEVVKEVLDEQAISFDQLEFALETSLTSKLANTEFEPNSSALAVPSNEAVKAPEVVSPDSSILSYFDLTASDDFNRRIEAFKYNLANQKHPVDLKLSIDLRASFLARIWTEVSQATILRIEALLSFLNLAQDTIQTDYQAILPYLFVGLLDPIERVRRLAANCLVVVAPSYSKQDLTPWGMNTVYGSEEKSSHVKWLSIEMVQLLLNDIVLPRLEECVLDNEFFIQGIIAHVLNGLKEKKYKALSSPLLEFLAGHAIDVQLGSVKIQFLRIINAFNKTNSIKSKLLAPILDTWIESIPVWRQRNIALADLHQQVVYIISEGERAAGIKFIESCVKNDDADLRTFACDRLIEIWDSLKADAHLSLLRFLLDESIGGAGATAINGNTASDVLTAVNISSDFFITLLDDSSLDNVSSISSPGGIVAKRRRRSSGSSTRQSIQSGALADVAERHLNKVTLILELLDQKRPEGSIQLLSQLFVVLSDTISLGLESKLPVHYTQQVLANCMIAVSEDLQGKQNLKFDSGSIRVDIIVSCIRSSTNPQVQNRLLLLIAELAKLSPEVVLHCVMPIFTFMGANTVRQDDEFSSHVIQQTISHVVPALVNSNRGESGVNPHNDIDFLLLSFMAAFVHIPRHRRSKLFHSLIETLGPENSLSGLLLLMGQKYSELTLKRKAVDAANLIQFCLSFLKGFNQDQIVGSFEDYLQLVQQIPYDTSSDADRKTEFKDRQLFSSMTALSDEELPLLKGDLIRFLSLVIEPTRKGANNKAISKIVEGLLTNLTTLRELDLKHKQDIIKSIYQLLDQILAILGIKDLVIVVERLLNSNHNVQIKKQALLLIQTNFDYSQNTDPIALEAAVEMFKVLIASLSSEGEVEILQLSIDALEVIVSKFGERLDSNMLIGLLDTLVGPNGLQNDNSTVLISAIACINSVISVIGALSIGHFSRIVPVLFRKVESVESQEIQLATFSLMAGMIKRIPAFMNSSLVKIFELIFKSDLSDDIRRQLLENIISSMEHQQVISGLTEVWKYVVQQTSSTDNWANISLYLDSMDNILDVTSKKVISSQAIILVKWLLEAFEFRGLSKDSGVDVGHINRVESRLIKTAINMVMKLNDKSFRPQFIRMVGWALEGENTTGKVDEGSRLTIFFKFLSKMLATLKSIVTSYYGYLVESIGGILDKAISQRDIPLARSILNSLTISFQYDRDEFWQSPARFTIISAALFNSLSKIDGPALGPVLVKAIVGLAQDSSSSQDQYKQLNDLLLAHMKQSCSVQEKIWAIRTLKGLYSKLGEEWVTMLPQLVPIIAELLDDDEESVELEVRRELVPVVEEILGESLDRYLS